MTHRITVRPIVADARASGIRKHIKAVLPDIQIESVGCSQSYAIDAGLSTDQLQQAAARLTNIVTEEGTLDSVLAPGHFSYAIEIGYLPGVTDNVGNTARQTVEDATEYSFKDGETIYSSSFIFLSGSISQEDAERIRAELHNPLIERASIYRGGVSIEFPVVVPRVTLDPALEPAQVDLDVVDEELARIGREGIVGCDGKRQGPLALSIPELKAIRQYFRKEKRKPTDVELESIASTWSEHCKHTIFNDPLDEIKEGIYKRYIKDATTKIRKKKGKKDFCVSVFKDNSGAIMFDKEYLVTHKVETHNAPSALDPFGGAVTAIVGVNRDCLGFGLGAKPIANIYGFFVANPNDDQQLFRDRDKKQALLPARRILEGVVKGINVGGNQSGIPTPLGFVAVDPSYRGKPLVFGGTVGLIPRLRPNFAKATMGKQGSGGRSPNKLHEKRARPGDYIVMLGGRVGLDGVHGATFSSETLTSGSPATAVQIGDPITQKKFSDALVREARDKALYTSITDNGAGGLSGSVGEMSREAGGCLVALESVPLKYPGLAPWQIWISESQERMTLAVPKKKWSALQKICARHDVEAKIIGTFTRSGRVIVRHRGRDVMNVSLKFLQDGRPAKRQRSRKPKKKVLRIKNKLLQSVNLRRAMFDILARPSVGSTAFISRQYDHEVLAQTITKPLHGRGGVNADAAVLRPLPNSQKGIILSHGYCPWYSRVDTYEMAAAAIDTAVRNAVCAGASRDHLAILDNFCWSNSEKPERLYQLKRAAKACYDIAVAYGTPFISGKDSMHNDFRGFTESGEPISIAALPTLLISALGVIPDIAKAQTVDFKMPGDGIYLLGETNDELGASEYGALLTETYGHDVSIFGGVPHVNTKKNAKTYDALAKAMGAGLVASALGLSRGGLGVALAKSAIAGQLGAVIDLSNSVGKAKKAAEILFSESQGRILVTVRPEAALSFESICKSVPAARIGEVTEDKIVSIEVDGQFINASVDQLTTAYRAFFKEW